VTLGGAALAMTGLLLVWHADVGILPPGAHTLLGALPLVLIAASCVASQAARGLTPIPLLKALLLALAFLFWAANQFWPESHLATLFNDIAIALFVLDVFLGLFRVSDRRAQT
jgi:uncharacterized membrane protein